MNKCREMVNSILNNKRLIKYFIMAIFIVIFELGIFQITYLILNNYYFSTIFSFVIGVILNWLCGRKFVFGVSSYSPLREFLMIFIASLGGVAIQLLVVMISVEKIGLYPIIGKIFSILFSFFWNYWFRAKFIFKK